MMQQELPDAMRLKLELYVPLLSDNSYVCGTPYTNSDLDYKNNNDMKFKRMSIQVSSCDLWVECKIVECMN